MKKITLLLLIFCSFHTLFSQNINISNYPYFDGECFLAVNPKNPKHIVTAWMEARAGAVAIATRSSFNGGKTWSSTKYMPHLHSTFSSADPSITFAADTSVYLAFIDFISDFNYSTPGDSGYDMVARSTNGGVSWGTPVKAIWSGSAPKFPIDRPWIEADRSAGKYSNRLYLTSMNGYFTPLPGKHPYYTVSNDNGNTWTPLRTLDDSIPSDQINEPAASLATSANGTLYATYFSYHTAYSPYARLVTVKSFDGGNTFMPYIVANLTNADALPASDSLLHGDFSIHCNPADTNNLVVDITSNHFGDPDIVSYNSHNAGKTWTGPTRINDDPIKNGIDQDMTWAGFSPNGNYVSIWRDRRNSGKGDSASFDIYGAISQDGGNTYSSNFKLDDSISPVVHPPHGNDFIGVALTDSNIYADWGTLQTGNLEIYFNSIAVNKIITSITSVSYNPDIKVEIYPNPFHTETNIVIHSPWPITNSNLLVFSTDGKKVAETYIGTGTVHTMSFNSLPAGVYTWTLIEEGDKLLAQGKWIIK